MASAPPTCFFSLSPASSKSCLPWEAAQLRNEIILEGVILDTRGKLNPRMLETKLMSFISPEDRLKTTIEGGKMKKKKASGSRCEPRPMGYWCPMRTSSPCCSHFLLCSTPRRRWTSARWGGLAAGDPGGLQANGCLRFIQGITKPQVLGSETVPDDLENSQRDSQAASPDRPNMDEIEKQLNESLAPEIKKNMISVTPTKEGIVVSPCGSSVFLTFRLDKAPARKPFRLWL